MDDNNVQMYWLVELYPCEWGGRSFRVPTWAVASEEDLRQGRDPSRMDTFILWGHRYIHGHLAAGMAIDIDMIEAQAEALQQRYKKAPVPFTPEESELGQRVFELLGEVAMVRSYSSVMDPLLNVLTANRWAEPVEPELPGLVQPPGQAAMSPGHWGPSLPDIGFVHLKGGNVRGVAVGRDQGTGLLRVVTLQDHEPDGSPFASYLWRYSLLLVPDLVFTPDRKKFHWESLWLHTAFFWSAYLDDVEEGKPRARVAVGMSQTIGEGLPLFELRASCPRSAVLGRSDLPTEEERRAFDEASKIDPNLTREEWFSYLEPTEKAVAAHVAVCKKNPVPFTRQEVDLLGELLSLQGGTITIYAALEILASWRWEESLNFVYDAEVPEFRIGKVPTATQSAIPLPAEGVLALSCGEVPVVAVDRESGTGRLRVVTLEESDCTCEAVGFEILKYDLFEVEETVFRPEPGTPLVPGISDEPRGVA
ncbi:MAG: hypothetical protein FDZ69_04635 [Deltaproteobacteria bacterium]|nr:MAG: hypothetical protein FDZ69_04635 [Deltaproteobacteria bacterium]